MTAKEFLERPGELKKLLDQARQRAAALKSFTEKVTTRMGVEAVPVTHTRNNAAMQDDIIRLMEAEAEVERLEAELDEAEMEVERVLAMIPDKLMHDFMVNRYLRYMTTAIAATVTGPYAISWGRKMSRAGRRFVQAVLDAQDES